MSISRSANKKITLFAMAALLGALLVLSAMFPVTGDDFYREAIGAQLRSVGNLLAILAQKWQTTNARVLGNLLAYCAGSRPILRAALRGGILFTLVLAAARNTGKTSVTRLLLCAAALLTLPRAMFAQIYPWAAGFFNYVPPVAATLLFFAMAEPVFAGQTMRDAPAAAICSFLLGFCGQFFVEHSTIYALLASLALSALYLFEQRRFSPVLLANAAGCALGAAALFLSPVYRALGNEGNAYTMGESLSAMLDTARDNLPVLLKNMIEASPVLYLSLAGLCLFFFAVRKQKNRLDFALAFSVAAASLWYFAAQFLGAPTLSLKWRLLIAAVWGISLLLAVLRWVPAGLNRRRAVFFIVSAAVAAAPLTVASPIGERCLFLSYVLLLLAACNLLSTAPVCAKLPPRRALAASAAVFATVWLFLFQIYLPIHQAEAARDTSIAQAMERGETTISVARYPNGEWLWEPESQKLGEQYYYETPNDITFYILEED